MVNEILEKDSVDELEAAGQTFPKGAQRLNKAMGQVEYYDGAAWKEYGGTGGAPVGADYLVGTAHPDLTAEIVVGATPGGELGGSWAAPTVDATHSGSAHHAEDHRARHISGGADAFLTTDVLEAIVKRLQESGGPTNLLIGSVPDGQFLKRSGTAIVGDPGGGGGDNISVNAVAAVDADFDDATPAAPADGVNVRWQKDALTPNNVSANSPVAAPTAAVDIGDASDAGSAASLARSDHQHAVPAPGAGYPTPTDFTAEADGVAATPARSDHRHQLTDPVVNPGVAALGTTTSSEGTDTAPARADHNHGIAAYDVMKTMVILSPAVDDIIMFRVKNPMTLVNLRAYQNPGTGSTVNAFKGTLAAPTLFRATNYTIVAADVFEDAGSLQNTSVVAGDEIYFRIATLAGAPTEISLQLEFTRP